MNCMPVALRFCLPILCLLLCGKAAVARELPAVGRSIAPDAQQLHEAFTRMPEGASVVRIGKPPANMVFVAAQVAAPPDRLHQMLSEVATYLRAVPSLVKAEPMPQTPGQNAQRTDVDWELEIPATNLKGRLSLSNAGESVSLDLREGAFSPGRIDLQVHPFRDGSILTVTLSLNARDANWITRLLVDREKLATPAISVTAALVLLRALAIAAAPDEARAIRMPSVPTQAPPTAWLQASTLAEVARILGDDVPTGLVHVAPGGRLLFAQIGWRVPETKEALMAYWKGVSHWQVLPGWKRITASPWAGTEEAGLAQRWSIHASFPFVSFDGSWDIGLGKTLRGVCTAGEGKGAVLGWDAVAVDDGSFAAFTMHPRLDRLGYLPRKFIEAEPLLEHGLSMGLAYVDAIALMRARPAVAAQPAPTHHHGRRIAATMGHEGADWLTRPTREAEEDPETLHRLLGIKKGMTTCDIGAGNGYHSLKMASSVGPKGRVYAVDIQPEMLTLLEARAKKAGVLNVTTVRGTENSTGLKDRVCDLALLVDVYHELSRPAEMLGDLHRSLAAPGQLVLVEFRAEDPAVPIKPLHKMSRDQILKELQASGFVLDREDHRLPWQHLMFFKAARGAQGSQ